MLIRPRFKFHNRRSTRISIGAAGSARHAVALTGSPLTQADNSPHAAESAMATSAPAGKLRALGSSNSSVDKKLTRPVRSNGRASERGNRHSPSRPLLYSHQAAPSGGDLFFGFAERHSRIAGEVLQPSMVDTSWDQLPCFVLWLNQCL